MLLLKLTANEKENKVSYIRAEITSFGLVPGCIEKRKKQIKDQAGIINNFSKNKTE